MIWLLIHFKFFDISSCIVVLSHFFQSWSNFHFLIFCQNQQEVQLIPKIQKIQIGLHCLKSYIFFILHLNSTQLTQLYPSAILDSYWRDTLYIGNTSHAIRVSLELSKRMLFALCPLYFQHFSSIEAFKSQQVPCWGLNQWPQTYDLEYHGSRQIVHLYFSEPRHTEQTLRHDIHTTEWTPSFWRSLSWKFDVAYRLRYSNNLKSWKLWFHPIS